MLATSGVTVAHEAPQGFNPSKHVVGDEYGSLIVAMVGASVPTVSHEDGRGSTMTQGGNELSGMSVGDGIGLTITDGGNSVSVTTASTVVVAAGSTGASTTSVATGAGGGVEQSLGKPSEKGYRLDSRAHYSVCWTLTGP